MTIATHDIRLASNADPANRTKRDAILDAAAAIFSQQGFAGASIDAIAVKAGVSRQTVYNQVGDKEKLFKAMVAELTQRSSAGFFRVLDTFPISPTNLQSELVDFACRLLRTYSCDPNSRWLIKLIENEASRYPELFEVWKEYGPGRKYPAIAARLAQLALAGLIELDDPILASRQFMALLTAEIRTDVLMGKQPSDAEIDRIATNAVTTFLKAFAAKPAAP